MTKERGWSLMSLGICLLLSSLPARALTTNSWAGAGSGAWESPNWSLGVPPASDQQLMLTNEGWKAVAIGSGTVRNFPQTLAVYSITLASPTNSMNELLLNYFGLETPLTTHGLYIGSNSTVMALDSALQVTPTTGPSGFSIGGTFIEAEFASVTAQTLTVGDLGAGTYYLTNGTLRVGTDEAIGGEFQGSFTQMGGSNSTSNLRVQRGSSYQISNGDFTGGITVNDGVFEQSGGTVEAHPLNVVRGSYSLSGGNLATAGLNLPGAEPPINGTSSFTQSGGTHTSASGFGIGMYVPLVGLAPGGYSLSGGRLISPSLTIGPFGGMDQSGGTVVLSSNLLLNGVEEYLNTWQWGNYRLSGGELICPELDLSIGNFSQSDGTNIIAGNLNVGPSPRYAWFNLTGGSLSCFNAIIHQDNLFSHSFDGGFIQGGGTCSVSNLLMVSGNTVGFVGYVLGDGELSAANVQVDSGASFDHRGGILRLPGTLTLSNGVWMCGPGAQYIGQLKLLGKNTGNSRLILPTGACRFSFGESSSVAWQSQATLTIENWQGSLGGGGFHQVIFGTNSSSLNSQQLSQIRFLNPLGFSGFYPAEFSTRQNGEIVPALLAAAARNTNSVQITWSAGQVLQSSTNSIGPFTDVPGASSPYVIPLMGPAQFFRLKRLPSGP
jgi:hypothetical protein